jgi:recombination protein RecR
MQSPHIQNLIQVLSRLPGLGPRSGRRLALHLLKKKEKVMAPLMRALQESHDLIQTCSICHNLDTTSPCHICTDLSRDKTRLCVVADVADIWAIERSQSLNVQYHVLGGLLSAMDGMGPDQLNIDSLIARAKQNQFSEIILALSATVEGQTTMHFLCDHLESLTGTITTLAHGVPIGGELDYLDDGTLTAALAARRLVA